MRPPGSAPALLLLLLAAAACLPPAAHAIYADQQGQYDWLQQHVGRVTLAALAPKPRARLFVATEQGAIAALSHSDGSLIWRRVLAEGDAASALLPAGTRLLTLTGGGKQLTAWDAATGAVAWAAAVAGSEQLSGAGAADVSAAGQVVVVAAAGSAKAYNLTSGKALWTASLPGSQGAAAVKLAAAPDRAGTWAVTLQPGASQLSAVQLSATGEVHAEASLDAAGSQLSSSQLALTGATVAALSSNGGLLCTGVLRQGNSPLSCQRLSQLLPAGTADVSGAALVRGSCAEHAVLQVAGGAAVLAVGGDGAASVVHFAPGAAASGCFVSGSGDRAAPQVSLATPSVNGLQTQVVSAADGSTVEEPAVAADLAPQRVGGQATGVAAVFAGALSVGGKQAASQLVVFADDILALVRGGRQAWRRHEELASIKDLLFTDLPAPTHENEAQWLASQPGLGEAFKAQVLTLQVQAARLTGLPLATPEEHRTLERYKAVTSDKLRPTRDPDGFRKQMLVLTAGGKLLSLHNGDGRVLWSLDFGPAAGLRKLAVWRVPHDVKHDVEVLALGTSPASGATTATIINAHTGAVVQTSEAPFAAADVLPLPRVAHDDSADQHLYVLAPAGVGGTVALIPDGPSARAAWEAARPGFSFWRADEEAGVVRGLGVTATGEVEERWAAVLAPPGGPGPRRRILAAVAAPAGEAVASPARVVGSGELKFKYLNPNTLLVAVGEQAGARAGEGGAGAQAPPPQLTVTLLDAVSGRVLFSQTHEDATGPVHAVLTENMAAYHYWGTEAHRWHMASVELFDASPTTLKVSELAFSETNTSVSSWDAPPLEAGSQAFICRLPVEGLAVTRSVRGNTAKQVLLLTSTGRVYLLDRRFLDPRRPIIVPGQKPTPEQQAEGLPPYQPELPVQGPMFATLDRRIARLSGVAVEAATLESTMLLAAHGMDLFHTRLMPSKNFDMVPDDFPYALLVLIVVGLTTATVVLQAITRRTAVKALWQ